MESRQIIQDLLYFLRLNTMGSAESGRIVAVATSEQALKEWYEAQKMEKGETVEGYHYTFKVGSPIRHFNPLYDWKPANEDIFQHGWFDEWVQLGALREDIYKIDL